VRELLGADETAPSPSSPAAAPDSGPRQPDARAGVLAQAERLLSGTLHVDRAVELVLGLLVADLADWAQVTLRSGRGYRCRFRLAAGPSRAVDVPARVVQPAGVLGRVLVNGAPELLPVLDGRGDSEPLLVSAVPAPQARAELAGIRPVDLVLLPLTGRGTTYGAITLARRAGDGFDPGTVSLLRELAERVSLGLDTTRAVAESRRVADVLSRGLKPPALPSLPGVELAGYHRVAVEQDALGGDFYDVHGEPTEWSAVVGDVCGKGVEAAALTGRVRQSVRTAAIVDRSPAAVLDLVNRSLIADHEETFVTAVCVRGRRDQGGLMLDVAAAGHPQPWLARRDGTVEPVPATGVALGLVADPGYRDHRVHLAAGDTLLLYTDGVLEAPGRRDRFGDHRLREVLLGTSGAAAGGLVEAVAVSLSAHVGDRPHDDIAIVAIQATE
jgi:serine phosphatase RsbU (regulator of sigma subunit)